MSEPESSTMVVPCRLPKVLVERVEKVAGRRLVNRQVVVREALELYVALGENMMRVQRYAPGAFDDTAGEKGS